MGDTLSREFVENVERCTVRRIWCHIKRFIPGDREGRGKDPAHVTIHHVASQFGTMTTEERGKFE